MKFERGANNLCIQEWAEPGRGSAAGNSSTARLRYSSEYFDRDIWLRPRDVLPAYLVYRGRGWRPADGI